MQKGSKQQRPGFVHSILELEIDFVRWNARVHKARQSYVNPVWRQSLSVIGVESPDTDCFKNNNNKKVMLTVKTIQLWLSIKVLRKLNNKKIKQTMLQDATRKISIKYFNLKYNEKAE